MSILDIKTYPAQVLKAVAKSVKEITPKLVKLTDDMLETMYVAPGIGLAAPQVGQSLRIIVLDVRVLDESGQLDETVMTELERNIKFPLRLFNPVITKKIGKTSFEEGCLSVPGFTEMVERFEYVEFTALDVFGKSANFKTDGLLAVCIQHEIDHLDGKLFIDRISTVKRGLIKSKIRKHGYQPPDELKQHNL